MTVPCCTSILIVYFVVHIAVSGGGILVFFNFQILMYSLKMCPKLNGWEEVLSFKFSKIIWIQKVFRKTIYCWMPHLKFWNCEHSIITSFWPKVWNLAYKIYSFRKWWPRGIVYRNPWISKFDVWPNWRRTLPLSDMWVNLSGSVQPTWTPFDSYGQRWQIQKPIG